MKKQTIIITCVFTWMLAHGLPVQGQSLQSQRAMGSHPYMAIEAQLKPYSPYLFQQREGIGISGSNHTRKTEYGRTRGGNILRGFGIGIGIGAAGGGLIGAVSWTECTDEGFMACLMYPESRAEAFLVGAVLGGIAGGFTGIIAGAFSKTGKRARHSVNLQLNVTPENTGGLAVNPSVSVNLPIKKRK